MKDKKIIIDKTVYGGVMVDKYFLHFDDGTDEQVYYGIWDQLEVGDEYYVEGIPESFGVDPDPFVEAMKDIVEGKIVPLDKALNEKPSIDWKEAHDMQQKLVISYVLENEELKDKNKFLEKEVDKLIDESNSLKDLCDRIEKEKESIFKSFETFRDRYYRQREIVEGYKKRAMEAEKKLEPSEKVDKICNQVEEVYNERDYYKMYSHILEAANEDLDAENKELKLDLVVANTLNKNASEWKINLEKAKETLINIWECFEMRDEIYHNDWVGLQALANKARICLEDIGYEWRNDKKSK
jgi:hypothetical protein